MRNLDIWRFWRRHGWIRSIHGGASCVDRHLLCISFDRRAQVERPLFDGICRKSGKGVLKEGSQYKGVVSKQKLKFILVGFYSNAVALMKSTRVIRE